MWKNILKLPTRGGWLTLANCAFWAVFAVWVTGGARGLLGRWAGLIILSAVYGFGAPLAIPFLLPKFGIPTADDVILSSCAIGLNSIAWGYGMSWLIGKLGGGGRDVALRNLPD